MDPWPPVVIAYDVGDIIALDAPALDALARLQLAARRLGARIELHHASAAVVDLIALAGLTDVLVIAESGVEMGRQVEQREQAGIDEGVLGPDGPVRDGEHVNRPRGITAGGIGAPLRERGSAVRLNPSET